MFYEKSTGSLPLLLREIELLDLDSGIRTYVKYGGKRQFAFLTRSPRGYTMMVYGIKSRRGKSVPSERLMVREFTSRDAVEAFVRESIARPVKAYVY